ncbi:ABC transporter ATP-binding protein [Jeotgalibacillus haloalkalitolerans]|uniref:Quaternary amine transport ATP-binding protein n=1 Tax=Jeotgalibacillus haloalkalitolerans TaxID=3104292 RepID=A0ABU5KKR1_9BACL|nr:betaine/proline/choline family ABC transporter ATP-binding protein [Jeotgalibacillus sp. HH7-29]MDZ5711848.1 betaine/proline/choline family ABC transporter ATP-binding protein [Jeotgalibacillus sp. HH7-29]
MIVFKNVSKTFEDGTEAIKNMNLHIKEGQLVALIGPSGCGKTTTMKMINRLISITSGTIEIDGKDTGNMKEVELRRNIGYVIQRIGLFPHMTIEENVGLIPKLKGKKKAEYEHRVDELLNLVGLDPAIYKKRYPLELSGGQQQRVGVVRALAGEPPIILMDEPFSALDPISREQLQDELKQLQTTIKKTIVFVTHDMDEALKVADEIVIMKDGVIQQIATPEDLLRTPANDFVRSFIGEERIQTYLNDHSRQSIKPFVNTMSESPPTDHQIDSSLSIKDAVRYFITHKIDTAAVKENDQIIGSLKKDRLLTALAGIDEEEAV